MAMAAPPGWERPKISESILDHVGMTPLVRINNIGSDSHACEILAKCEFLSAGGSVKDRIGKRMILDAEKQGRIKPGDTLIEPTSGNTGIGLAITALIRGYRMVITLPEKMSNEKMNLLKALGAEIIRTPTEAAWDAPDSHIGVAQRLHAQIPNSHILDQYTNPSNPLAHYEGTAEEILYQCDGRLDMVVIGAGTGGTITGVAKRLREVLGEHVTVVGVDPQGSILAEPDTLNATGRGASYLVEGIGYDFIPQVLDRSLVDEWVKTDDTSALKMARRLLREEGLLCGGSSGAAMHAAMLAAARLGAGKRVVVILPDATRNYMSKFITDEWMVANDLEPPSLLTRSSALLGLLDQSSSREEWWAKKTVVDLHLPSPITVPPTLACSVAAEVMREHGIDQLPVVDDALGVVGVVTLGHLSSKILSKAASPRDPCSMLMFTRFAQAPLATPLAAFSRIFERDAFCIVVAPMRHLASRAAFDATQTKKVVVAVCTQVDLLKYVMDGSAAAGEMMWQQYMKPPAQPHSPPTNRAHDLSRGRNELDCAQMAWAFMKPPSPPTSPVKPPTNRAHELSRGRNELDCAQLAWAFMKPPSPPTSPVKLDAKPPTNSAHELESGNNELSCAQMAWAFMKPPSPRGRCSAPRVPRPPQSAPEPDKHFASPLLTTESGEVGLPKLDLSGLGHSLGDDQPSADDASGQPTRFATPNVAPVAMGHDAVDSLKLPKSLRV